MYTVDVASNFLKLLTIVFSLFEKGRQFECSKYIFHDTFFPFFLHETCFMDDTVQAYKHHSRVKISITSSSSTEFCYKGLSAPMNQVPTNQPVDETLTIKLGIYATSVA